ncbi:aminotransferase class I/II-fold pyridoxal phosphate-dependent enzyme [Tardisphaera miroshnichenkoae]
MQIGHFQWMRTHKAGFDLSSSGVTPVNPEDLEPIDTDVLSLLGELYSVSSDEIALVHGTQEGNFLSLVAIRHQVERAFGFLPEYEPIRVLPSALGLSASVAQEMPLPRSSVLLASNPNNPTGKYMSADDLEELSEELEAARSFAVIDSVFSDFVGLKAKLPLPNVIVTGSTSKFYTISGVKLGWVIAEKQLIDEIKGYADLISPGPFDLELKYAARAIAHKKWFEERNAATISQNERELARLDDVLHVQGMPIAFLASHCGEDSISLANRLLRLGVMTIPGHYFGVKTGLRVGLGSVNPSDFKEAVELIAQGLASCADQTISASA